MRSKIVNQRKFERHPCRIRCSLRVQGEEYSGFVTDLSAMGLFIQTPKKLEPGTEVIVDLLEGADSHMELSGVVARKRKSHPSATQVIQPGIGVQINGAPEAFYQMVMDLDSQD